MRLRVFTRKIDKRLDRMANVNHDYIEGLIAEFSWRKQGEPDNLWLTPFKDMLQDIAAQN